ncbi:LacI family DNA-binding transcriptional regulator [Prosthecomicrobium sp. N25]|uniref:LacI family DNA-binding transcriptional regulator n=1 Tax=Prosthecomicrobium sp. N25 TaxID=3129254 RepID=UPI0030768F8B
MSLRLIAQTLGLSITTVSRALAGYSDVAQLTRDRVRAEADRIGYVPNEVARRLQSGRSDVIGFVIPDQARGFDDRYFLNIIEGAWSRLSGTEFDLLVMSAPEGPGEVAAYRRIVEGRRVDGVIVPRIRADDPRIAYLNSVGFPYVAFGGRPDGDDPVVSVEIDCGQALGLAVEHLAAFGHRRIACLTAEKPYRFSQARADAFAAAAQRFGMEPLFMPGSLDEDGGRLAMARLIAQDDRPTAAVAVTDRMGVGALQTILESGLVPGRDMSLITFGDNPVVQFSNPPITAIRIPTQQMAEHAVEILIDLRDGIRRPVKELWDTELAVRASTGPAPGTDATTALAGAA